MNQPERKNAIDNAAPPQAGEANGDQVVETVPLYRTPRIVAPALVALLLIAAAIVYWFVGMRNFVTTDDAFVDANRVSLSAKLLGRVAKLNVDEADAVKPGDVLVLLDDSDLQALKEQSQANLGLAEANVSLAKVAQEKADQDFARADAQFKKMAASAEMHDHARMEAASARAKSAIATAQVAAAQAQLHVAETQLKNTVIMAPMSGIVAKRWVLDGDVVQPGQPIFTIYDISSVWITANLEETKVANIKVGNPAEINVDAFPNQPLTGKVVQIGTFTASQFSLIPPNNASGNFTKVTQRLPVKIAIENPSQEAAAHLVPGLSVEVRIKVK